MNETSDGGVAGASATEPTESDSKVRRVARSHGFIAFLAVFVFWAPFVLTGSGWILVTGPLLASAIVVLSAYNAYETSVGREPLITSILVFVLAAGAAASPFLLAVDEALVLGVTTAAGALAALVSIYTIVAGRRLTE